MSDGFTKPFTKAEMDAMRREGGGPADGTSGRDRTGPETIGDEAAIKRSFWAKLRRVGGRIPFAEDLVAAFYCATDPATPNRVRFILMGAIAYFVLPTDAVADFLPLLGFADDAAVLATAVTQVAGSITETHRAKAREALLQDAPQDSRA
ncbi:YkvA family protein [Microvirga pudoricolor]|uniref:YkvA family protein n=1 Tax=Microvirga pudoricolor TaxID=2778729 RepID=UPI00194E42FF|nr:YkvA family protein [Microvirga pudoricolor]MBM6593790.1 DUF1232 domain-containing protein [Microvirga pudoricolor]